MTSDLNDATKTNASWDKINAQLADITKRINEFEAKKLGEQKTALDTLLKKLKTSEEEYEKKFPELKKRWTRQGQEIEQLSKAITCTFPHWKDDIKDCVCTKLNAKAKNDDDISRMTNRTDREKARDDAKFEMDSAKANLDAWGTIVQGVESRLTANEKLINEIQTLIPGPKQAQVIYIFWFQLLPSFDQLRPKDVSPKWDDQSMDKLCDASGDEKGYQQDSNDHAAESPTRAAPWLVDPSKYGEVLYSASEVFDKKKDKFAEAEAAVKSEADALANLIAKRDALSKSLDEDIKKCLVEKNAKQSCESVNA